MYLCTVRLVRGILELQAALTIPTSHVILWLRAKANRRKLQPESEEQTQKSILICVYSPLYIPLFTFNPGPSFYPYYWWHFYLRTILHQGIKHTFPWFLVSSLMSSVHTFLFCIADLPREADMYPVPSFCDRFHENLTCRIIIACTGYQNKFPNKRDVFAPEG